MPLAELTDARLSYQITGSGDPLLLIPGLGSTRETFDPAIADLETAFTLIRIDNRGIGASVAKRPIARLHDYAADLVELLDHLQLDRVNMLGLSLGGMIAQRFAMDHASRLDRLVLVSTAHRFTAYLRETAMMIGRALRYLPRPDYVRFVELLGAGPAYVDADPIRIDRRVAQVLARNTPRHVIVDQLRAMSASDPSESEFRIAAPTLVIAGESDALIPSGYGRAIARAIGDHARFELLTDTGHNPFAECPDLIVPLIARFLGARADAKNDGDRAAA